MTTIIKPTIGRRVWYWPGNGELALQQDGIQACDAGICFVHDDRTVNLTVADHVGQMHSRIRVPLLQQGDEEPHRDIGFAMWMPYQVGQAAKAGGTAQQAKADNQQERIDHIARVCHEVNRAYCQALGDGSQPAWEDAPQWQRESARMGVDLHLMGDFGPEASHVSWMQEKLANGWTYGPVKDPAKLQHPCMVPFDQLPREQQAKDFIFRAVVHALKA